MSIFDEAARAAARRERQRATAAMTRCECGNTARLGSLMCNRCAGKYDEQRLADDAVRAARDALESELQPLIGIQAPSVTRAIAELIEAAIQRAR